MDPLLDRTALVDLFAELAERLQRRGVRANIYVVGGAAMALLYDARRATRDIDSVVLEGQEPLVEEVRLMARLRGLPGTWLNEQATMYVSREPDTASTVVFDHPSLIVAAASAEHLLAMKLLAARASDVTDLRLLLRVVGIPDVASASAVLQQVFPGEVLRDRSRLLLEDILNQESLGDKPSAPT